MFPGLANLDGRPVIIGAGAAGMMAALQLAPIPCVLISLGPIGTASSSILAQGGVAAAIAPDDDIALHLADTIAAGDGHCDIAAAARIIAAAPEAIARLEALGARFDRNADGSLATGLEAAHSRRRILHAGGDASGAEIIRALAVAVRAADHITVLEGVRVTEICVDDGVVTGVVVQAGQEAQVLHASQVALATGGIGGLYSCTTNPLASFGAGVALAARAGAALADMEFVQFHPTALSLAHPSGRPETPAPLISEAVRGEGAILVNDRGERFLADTPGAELAARDVVARAIWRQQQAGRQTFIDARQKPGPAFASRFPAITRLCAAAGLDPTRDLLPVTPAAHYHMGGVAVDARGRTTVAGLSACGEVACTGLHGANRLASNSLIEALVCGTAVAEDVRGAIAPCRRRARAAAPLLRPAPDPAPIRALMDRHVGLERNADGLSDAIAALAPLAFRRDDPVADPAAVALLIAVAACQRKESRGAHCRADFPDQAAHNRQPALLLAELQATFAPPCAPAPRAARRFAWSHLPATAALAADGARAPAPAPSNTARIAS